MCCIRYRVILEQGFSRPNWYGWHLYFAALVLGDTNGTLPVICCIPVGWCHQYIICCVLFSSGDQNPIIQQWCHLPNLVTADDALISGASNILCTNERWGFSATFHERNTHLMKTFLGYNFNVFYLISITFCSCTDSTAVSAYSKFMVIKYLHLKVGFTFMKMFR